MLYRLTLTAPGDDPKPIVRTLDRDDLVQAVDSAMRWLRLSRNVTRPGLPRHDRWSIAQPTTENRWVVVVSGDMTKPLTE